MRTISTAQEELLNSVKYNVHLRIEVESSTGQMVALSSLGGADWIDTARWDWNIDQPVAQLTATLRRDHGPSTGESLAPLDEESTHNLELGSTAFGALIDVGRDIDIYTAVTAPGSAAPATSEYDWVFAGEIDDVAWQASPMTLVARSKNFASLNDRWIESSTYLYGTSSGDSLEIVIENVMADWTDLSTTVLLTPSTPGFLVAPAYSPDKKSVLSEVTVLSQLIGWQVRDVWSTASTSWRIQFDTPDRTATSSDAMWTFGPEHYFDVRQMSISRTDVRNYVNVIYGPADARTSTWAESTASQDKYGRRWMELEEGTNSPIGTSSEASALANAALSDLQDPPALHEIEVPYFYPAELNDFYQFDPNGIHYSTQQYLAAYGITHELSNTRQRTSIRVRGKPAGQYTGWLTYPGGGNAALPEIGGIEIGFDENGQAVVSLSADEALTKSMYFTVGDGSAPTDPTSSAGYEIVGFEGTAASTNRITTGNEAYVSAVAQNDAGVLGAVYTARKERRLGMFHKEASTRSVSGTTLTTLETITIPANKLGTGGGVRITVVWSITNVFDLTRVEVLLEANSIVSKEFTNSLADAVWCQIVLNNDGATNAQDATSLLSFPITPFNQTDTMASTEDSTADMDIIIKGQRDDANDTVDLVYSLVEYLGTT